MNVALSLVTAVLLLGSTIVRAFAENVVIAEDDATQSAYGGSWDNSKSGGNGFGNWALTTEGNDNDRHSGFYIASTSDKPELKGIAKDGKAFGVYANGSGFEQAVAYRNFEKPLQIGDSFSFMMENAEFEKKFGSDDPTPGSIGIVLRSGTANSTVADYNKDALFEFGYYQGKPNYQIYDGSGPDKTGSGVPFTDSGVSVTVTITGADTYDLEIQTMNDKKITRLSGRKFSNNGGSIQSMAVFDRNGEKYDAYFNQFQVTRTSK
jgi:hypothetical protein